MPCSRHLRSRRKRLCTVLDNMQIKATNGALITIDDLNFRWASQFKWHITSHGYAACNKAGGYMHRLLLGLKPSRETRGLVVDHVNRDKLDNRLENLRIVPVSQNIANSPKRKNNSTGYKGVSFDARRSKFVAYGSMKRKTHFIASCETAKEAHEKYKEWCEKNGRFHE